ncbi:hypothetical protein JOD45_002021 [Scopulibacillus daqui]|uniref:Uncharacterized protein n=1 Tax=Scopulibacillus daqui TaxID=1469162 RepID=A0ABS2Q2P5_9BACL|nr:hypothetical protein [Scopulibacillus daqui]MBM7645802.1 hypothetical protein [Scopulibacillus daqui]
MASVIITILIIIIAGAFTKSSKDRSGKSKKAIKKPQTKYRSNANKYREQPHQPHAAPDHLHLEKKQSQVEKKPLSSSPVSLKRHQSQESRSSKAPVISKKSFQEAFILSECLDKPRAFRPHPSIRKYQHLQHLNPSNHLMNQSNDYKE